MRKLVMSAIAFLFLVAVSFAASSGGEKSKGQRTRIIMTFQSMYGVDGPFVGDANPIRGVNGDELPWEIENLIRGKLDTAGSLQILVRGLVFKDDPSVPPQLRGRTMKRSFAVLLVV